MKTPGSNPVLLTDVARLAGVSMATASMALRAQGTIALKTRDLVRKVAEEIGYRPNLAASMLARHKQEGVLPNVPVALIGMGVKDRYAFPAQEFVRRFTEHATQRGFLVEEPEPAAYPSISKLLRVLYYRGVRGITLSHSFDTSQLTKQDVRPFSFLFHGQPLEEHRFHRVSTEVFESTRFLWETVWARGYRRIGAALYRHPQDIQDDFAREAAVVNCQIRYNAPRVPIYTGSLNGEELIAWAKETRPDAILGFSIGQYYTLRDAGFKIPEEIGFVCLHVSDNDASITGLYEDFDELGRITVSQLDSMIRHNETGFPARPHELLVSPVFEEGRTLPHRPGVKEPRAGKSGKAPRRAPPLARTVSRKLAGEPE